MHSLGLVCFFVGRSRGCVNQDGNRKKYTSKRQEENRMTEEFIKT